MPTAKIVHDTRRQKQDGTFPLKIRITDGDRQRYFPVILDHRKVSMTKKYWDATNKQRPKDEYAYWKDRLDDYRKSADNLIGNLEVFSFEAFKDTFYSDRKEGNDLFGGFSNYLNRLNEQGRSGTYNAYSDSESSIKKYKKEVKYTDIDKYWLEGYCKYMKNVRGNSSTTQKIYINALRAVLNAEGKKYLKHSPFDGFTIPRGEKRTHYYLTEGEVRDFAEYQTDNEQKAEARDFWMFSFRCNGINYKDIAYLHWKDIHDDEIVISRQKTKGRTDKKIYIPLSDKIQRHIDLYGNPRGKFVFDIIQAKDSADRASGKISQFIKMMNHYTSEIGKELEFKVNVTSTVARHSFATVLYRVGNNLVDIRDALGHTSIQTTENYIGSLGLGERDKLKRLDI